VVAYHATARRNYKRSMRQRIEWQDVWAKANADVSLQLFGDRLVDGVPDTMPFEPEELVSKTFDMDWALERLAAALEMPADHH
jgi:hypothetical protein